MRGKGNQNQVEEEYEEDDFGSRKDGPSSSFTVNNNNSSKDGKNSDRANAIRSKHSVTEQRRRSKINERFQILRDLIPHSDQKRDTASFLLEVIEYVQYLQEKVQKYEGPYQGWSPEPAKLMPWRNSHWRLQSSVGHPQAIKNGSVPGETFPGKLDENNIALTPAMLPSTPNLVESDHVACKVLEQQPELANKVMPLPTPAPIRSVGLVPHPCQLPVSDAQSAECPITSEMLNQQELAIEAGTINISSVYSQELLNTLTQSLQSAGVDLSQANISVQIDLGKRANRGLTPGTLTSKGVAGLVPPRKASIDDQVLSYVPASYNTAGMLCCLLDICFGCRNYILEDGIPCDRSNNPVSPSACKIACMTIGSVFV